VDIADVHAAIQAVHVAEARERIAQAVEDGTMTQAQADWMLEGLDNGYMMGPGGLAAASAARADRALATATDTALANARWASPRHRTANSSGGNLMKTGEAKLRLTCSFNITNRSGQDFDRVQISPIAISRREGLNTKVTVDAVRHNADVYLHACSIA
jgi:hypothetical protein